MPGMMRRMFTLRGRRYAHRRFPENQNTSFVAPKTELRVVTIRYALNEVLEHGTDAQWWRKRFLSHVVSRYFDFRPPAGQTRVVDHDWDTLLLLDACRYDLFEEVDAEHPLPGELSLRRSIASGTPDYLAANFGDETFHDVVYVTANPYVDTELPDGTFHDVVSVWREDWDEQLGTVLPEAVADAAREAHAEYPHKRLVVHFNQPHTPFVGATRLEGRGMANLRARAMDVDDRPTDERTPFERLGAGEVSRGKVWRAYRSNLERVFPVVEDLLVELRGLTAVTSDHGNALGEPAWPFPIRVYGHPLGILIPALIEVPWQVYQNGARVEIREDTPVSENNEKKIKKETKKRLRALGYTQ